MADLASQYTGDIADRAETIGEIPSFQEVLPFYSAWQRIVPQATLAAQSQINPEAIRQQRTAQRGYMGNLASSGGQRFGRGLAGRGEIKASGERERLAQLQDWLSQYQQGYNQLFYQPSESAWNQALTQGIRPDSSLANIPTWDDLYDRYNSAYGVGASTSPFYG
ncbi:MAG: hypothetical protein ACTSPI_17125 [Candidatus Heimdallarchaeaceae archaeon]